MSYLVKYSETTNPSKPSIIVQDQTLENTSTSLTFVGKNYAGYAQSIAENFLHLLENFSKNTSPINPVEGQLWYDNNPGENLLKVFDSTTWSPVGGVKKAPVAPEVSNSVLGDLWVDTAKNQLNVFSGSNWLLVGPSFSAGIKTGPEVETIVDTSNVSHNVLSLYAENNRISIISKSAFTPKTAIDGFTTINQGVNLSTVDSKNVSAPTKFWGRASEADSLNINGTSVGSVNFLRSDTTSTTNYSFRIRSNEGLLLGGDLGFSISTSGSSTLFYSKTTGRSIDFKLTGTAGPYTAIHIDTEGKVGIGFNNNSPSKELDISGGVYISQDLEVAGTSVNSIKTAGGLNVAGRASIGLGVTANGTIDINVVDENGPIIGAVAIRPGTDQGHLKYDIGTESRKFRNVYAEKFIGTYTGTFTGNLTGNISGSASRLASPTAFSLTGDIVSNTVNFDGQTVDGKAIFTTELASAVITSKTQVDTAATTDIFLLHRPGIGLRSVTQQNLIKGVPTIPIGTIFPYAGATPPNGYLLCDGAEVLTSKYSQLFLVIGDTYKKPNTNYQGSGTFALPDLRGRFALGRDNMNNNIFVPPASGTVPINTVGSTAGNVSDPKAQVLGGRGGSQSRALITANLPQHTHNLKDANGVQYYTINPNNTTTTDTTNVFDKKIHIAYETSKFLNNSGKISGFTSDTQLAQPFDIMNPFLAMNYIIYTGTSTQ